MNREAARNDVQELAARLASRNAVERHQARRALVDVGSAAVPALMAALEARDTHLRWEAAKALADIADPSAAEPLVAALGDKNGDVRWVIGEALIALRRDGLRPLLEVLTRPDSELPDGWLKGAHHVLHDLVKREDLAELLLPVLRAFDEPEPAVSVPIAARQALRSGFGG